MEFFATANAMFGSGWVWLVIDQLKYLRILATYNAGTPYGEAHRRQERDMNTYAKPTEVASFNNSARGWPSLNYQVTEQTSSAASGQVSWPRPVLVVNCWEHAYIHDYGVNGKAEYLERWWGNINWAMAASKVPAGLSNSRANTYN